MKYRMVERLRVGKPPYSLVGPGDVVVQVGAPADTLLTGRSRGLHLALRSRGGRAIIVEPDPSSAEDFRSEGCSSWGSTTSRSSTPARGTQPSTLTLFVDPSHPATNFVEGTVDYSDERMKDFTRVEVPVDDPRPDRPRRHRLPWSGAPGQHHDEQLRAGDPQRDVGHPGERVATISRLLAPAPATTSWWVGSASTYSRWTTGAIPTCDEQTEQILRVRRSWRSR